MYFVNFVNCTPHAITVEGLGTLQPSGTIPRVSTQRMELAPLAGVRMVYQNLGDVEGLPDPQPNTTYVVSALVLSALRGTRPDVVAPDTGPDAVRENGQVVAVRGFVC